MNLIKRVSMLLLLCYSLLLMCSCKTKQAIAEENRFQQELDDRAAKQNEALANAGVDADQANSLVDKMKEMDEKLMNFMASDPSTSERSQFLSDMMREREAMIRGSMSPEEYEAYRNALLEQTMKKSREEGAPLVKPRG